MFMINLTTLIKKKGRHEFLENKIRLKVLFELYLLKVININKYYHS